MFPSGINSTGFTPVRTQEQSDTWVGPTVDNKNIRYLYAKSNDMYTLNVTATTEAGDNKLKIAFSTDEYNIAFTGGDGLDCKSCQRSVDVIWDPLTPGSL